MNFDLNLENYKKPELEEIFDLPSNYNENILQQKADMLKQKIGSDKKIDESTRKKTLEFLIKSQKLLLESFRNKNQLGLMSAPSLPPIPALDTNIPQTILYHTDLELQKSAIIAENGSNFVIDRRANSTPYNFSFPGDAFPGIINPLMKRTIIKNLNIDTRFRDNYYTSLSTNFNFDIPYKFNSVVNMQLTSFECVQSYYTIASCLGNNFMSLQLEDTHGALVGDPEFIFLPDGDYTGQNLMAVLNAIVATFPSDLSKIIFSLNLAPGPNGNDRVTIDIDPTSGLSFTFTVNFAVDKNGNIDSTPLQQKFGWLMGFRSPIYAGEGYYTSEGVLDLSGPKYLFLVIDDYNNNVNENFFGAFNSSMLHKNILARFSLGPKIGNSFVTYGAITSGSFSTPRTYFGPVDIQKLHIQLLDEYGRILNLNNMDYSFVLALTTAYDI
jgi:hypothetical protein